MMAEQEGKKAAAARWHYWLTGGIAQGTTIALLALLLVAVNELDLVTALRMIGTHGLGMELNPIARAMIHVGGAAFLASVKLLVAISASLLLVRLARKGSVRLARNALVVCVIIGMVGVLSNLV